MALRSMDRFECEYILKELSEGIGRRFKKAYMLTDGSIKISLDGISYVMTPGKRVNRLTIKREDYRDHTFTQKIRKEMGREKLVGVSLLKGDRVFLFEFEKHTLLAEVFGKGAVLFYESDELKAYLNKPRVEAEDVSIDALFERYAQKPLGAMLVRLLGKKYSKAILEKYGFVEKEQVAKQDIEKIREAVEWLKGVAKPYLCPTDYSLIDLGGCTPKDSLSEAMDAYYKLEEVDVQREKLSKSLAKQKEKVEEYLNKAATYRKIANWIFSHSEEVTEILEKARKGELKADKKNKTVKVKVRL